MVQDWATAKATKSKFWGRLVTSILCAEHVAKTAATTSAASPVGRRTTFGSPNTSTLHGFLGDKSHRRVSRCFSSCLILWHAGTCEKWTVFQRQQELPVELSNFSGRCWPSLGLTSQSPSAWGREQHEGFLPISTLPKNLSLRYYQNILPVLSSTCHVWRDCFLKKNILSHHWACGFQLPLQQDCGLMWAACFTLQHRTAPGSVFGRDAALRKVVSQGISAWLCMTHDASVFAIKYCMLWLWKPHFQILSTLHKARHIMPITLKLTRGVSRCSWNPDNCQSSNLPERSSYARHFSEFQLGLERYF